MREQRRGMSMCGHPCLAARLALLMVSALLLAGVSIGTGGAVAAGDAQEPFDSFFLREDPTEWDMWESRIVVGPDGAFHTAFSGDLPGGYEANYAYCPAGCADPDQWTVVGIGTVGGTTSRGSTTIALTPDGRPRMMWFTTDVDSTAYWGAYKYAECDTNCTDPFSWIVSQDLPAGTHAEPHSVHYFDVDSQGRPRFVVYGDTFVRCDSNCTQLSSWQSYRYTSFTGVNGMVDPYFLIGSDDRPRMLSMPATGSELYYWECNTNCAAHSDWTYAAIAYVGGMNETNSWGFALDDLNRPRIALYVDTGLYYVWCDGDPTIPSNWDGYQLLPQGYGHAFGGVDLAIDSDGRPHIVHSLDPYTSPALEDYGLGYARCTADCQSGANAVWEADIVETTADLDLVEPIPVNPVEGCTMSFWMYAGMWPSIAVDHDGNAHITHYTHHVQHSIDNPECENLTDRQLIRLAAAGGGAVPIPVTDVGIGGPASCNTGSGCTFTAAVSPPNATSPITYTWTATDQPQQVEVDTNDITLTWTAAGAKTVGVVVENSAGSATNTYQVVVTPADAYQFYLPLVVR